MKGSGVLQASLALVNWTVLSITLLSIILDCAVSKIL